MSHPKHGKQDDNAEILRAFGGDTAALASALMTMMKFKTLISETKPKMDGLTQLPLGEQVLAGLRIVASFAQVADEAQAVLDKAKRT